MSRWDRWGWYAPTPKKPPPKRGIKMKRSGSTWWGRRWVEALERMSRGYSNRLARGRTYARAGRTYDLVIEDGKVTARVTGSRSTPYKVTISLARLADRVWDEAIAAMAGKAQFSAELLAGQMPQEIDAAFKAAGASIFPVKEAELTTNCSCPDWANPCKHVAATHYVLGEALDRDPFLLFELRGRSRSQVLDALRAARADARDRASTRQGEEGADASPQVPSVTLGRIEADEWDEPPESLPSLRLSFEAPPVSGGVLRQLGTPSGWTSETSLVEMLGPMIRAAAERARAIAMAEGSADQEAAPGTVVGAERENTGGTSKKLRKPVATLITATVTASLPKSVTGKPKARKAATRKTTKPAKTKPKARKITAKKRATARAEPKRSTSTKGGRSRTTAASGGTRKRRAADPGVRAGADAASNRRRANSLAKFRRKDEP